LIARAGHKPRRIRRPHPAAALVIGTTLVYVVLVVGPLFQLFAFAPCSMMICPATLEIVKRTLTLTLHTSLIATALSVAFGIPAALCLGRISFRGKAIVNALVELPISLPPLVIGVALLLVWGRRGVLGSYLDSAGYPLSFTSAAVVIAQFVVASPYFVRIAKAAIEQVPRALEEASHTLGVGTLRTYLRVTLPLARGGILTALLTCWARAMSEFGATIMFAGNFPGRTQTVPLAIFTTMQYDITSSVGLSIVMLTFSLASFAVAQLCISRFAPAHV